jgi:hypothetical protein
MGTAGIALVAHLVGLSWLLVIGQSNVVPPGELQGDTEFIA